MKRMIIPALLLFLLSLFLFEFFLAPKGSSLKAQSHDIHLEFHPPPDKSPHFAAFVSFSYHFAAQFLSLAAGGEISEEHEIVIRFTQIISKDSPKGFAVILISIDPENLPYLVFKKAIKMEEINSEEKVKKKTAEIAKLVLRHIKEIEALAKEKKEKERSMERSSYIFNPVSNLFFFQELN